MAKKISTSIDIKILEDLGLGLSNKDIAVRYGVSPSYVSKLKTGKKTLNFHIVGNETVTNLTTLEVITHLESRIAYFSKELNMHTELLKQIKKEHN